MDNSRLTDSELLFLIAQGDLNAKRILDERYIIYCKKLTRDFYEKHPKYGFTYEDFFNASIVGYCNARMGYNFATSESFYPYFKFWAIGEMKGLLEEGSRFFLNENPNKFLSLDITYKNDKDTMLIAEYYGTEDQSIAREIKHTELMTLLTDHSKGMTETEAIICCLLILDHKDKEIREFLNLSYKDYSKIIKHIKTKFGRLLNSIIK